VIDRSSNNHARRALLGEVGWQHERDTRAFNRTHQTQARGPHGSASLMTDGIHRRALDPQRPMTRPLPAIEEGASTTVDGVARTGTSLPSPEELFTPHAHRFEGASHPPRPCRAMLLT